MSSIETFPKDLFTEDDRKKLFPVCANGSIYLNNAAVAPLPRFSAQGYNKYVDICSRLGEKHWLETFPILEETRSLVAEYLNCKPQEIAFTRNVSEGLSILASGLDWKQGDQVLISDIEFPANVFPWLNLNHKGIETGYIKNCNGRTGLNEIMQAVNSSTRLVSISSVQFFSGYRAELDQIGQFLKEKNILFCVDGVQHIGAFPIDVKASRIDFLAGACHKWLMCGEGLGFVYCREDLVESIKQQAIGWQSVQDWSDYFKRELKLKQGALRFETGGISVATLHALNNSLKFIKNLGLSEISSHILALSKLVRNLARERNFLLVTGEQEPDPDRCSGITTFAIKDVNAEQLVNYLGERKIFVSAREGNIRLSPSYYNVKNEIQQLFEAIDQFLSE